MDGNEDLTTGYFSIGVLHICYISAKNSKYDQEKTQSQTADKPMAPRGRATQQS